MKKYNRVIRRIKKDYAEFKKDMLSFSVSGVYDSAYEICRVEEFYNMLIYAYEFTDNEIRSILRFKGNVLRQLYQGWLDSDYSDHDCYESVIKEVMRDLEQINAFDASIRRAGYKAAA